MQLGNERIPQERPPKMLAFWKTGDVGGLYGAQTIELFRKFSP
jgi:hypothetical protein